jgi:hypothetical protein
MNSRYALVLFLLWTLLSAQLAADSAPGRLLWSARTGG